MFNNNISLKNDFKVVNNNVNNSNQQDGSIFFSNSLQNPNQNNHRLNFFKYKHHSKYSNQIKNTTNTDSSEA
jgi:hypothetical protein